MPSSVQGLFLALCPDITPDGAQGPQGWNWGTYKDLNPLLDSPEFKLVCLFVPVSLKQCLPVTGGLEGGKGLMIISAARSE